MATGGGDCPPHERESDDDENETESPFKNTRSKKKEEAKEAEDTTTRNRENREQRKNGKFQVPPQVPPWNPNPQSYGERFHDKNWDFFFKDKNAQKPELVEADDWFESPEETRSQLKQLFTKAKLSYSNPDHVNLMQNCYTNIQGGFLTKKQSWENVLQRVKVAVSSIETSNDSTLASSVPVPTKFGTGTIMDEADNRKLKSFMQTNKAESTTPKLPIVVTALKLVNDFWASSGFQDRYTSKILVQVLDKIVAIDHRMILSTMRANDTPVDDIYSRLLTDFSNKETVRDQTDRLCRMKMNMEPKRVSLHVKDMYQLSLEIQNDSLNRSTMEERDKVHCNLIIDYITAYSKFRGMLSIRIALQQNDHLDHQDKASPKQLLSALHTMEPDITREHHAQAKLDKQKNNLDGAVSVINDLMINHCQGYVSMLSVQEVEHHAVPHIYMNAYQEKVGIPQKYQVKFDQEIRQVSNQPPQGPKKLPKVSQLTTPKTMSDTKVKTKREEQKNCLTCGGTHAKFPCPLRDDKCSRHPSASHTLGDCFMAGCYRRDCSGPNKDLTPFQHTRAECQPYKKSKGTGYQGKKPNKQTKKEVSPETNP